MKTVIYEWPKSQECVDCKLGEFIFSLSRSAYICGAGFTKNTGKDCELKVLRDDMEDYVKSKIVLNQITTPDGTILTSRHRHDFVEHTDTITGKKYAVDGGNDYLRRVCGADDYVETFITSDSPFEVIRENYVRGTFDKQGKRIYITLAQMKNGHLANCIKYNLKRGADEDIFANQMYKKELLFRGIDYDKYCEENNNGK